MSYAYTDMIFCDILDAAKKLKSLNLISEDDLLKYKMDHSLGSKAFAHKARSLVRDIRRILDNNKHLAFDSRYKALTETDLPELDELIRSF